MKRHVTLVSSLALLVAVAACAAPTAAPSVPPPVRQPAAPPERSGEVQGVRVQTREMVPTTVSVTGGLAGGPFATDRQLQIREGFSISVIARVPGARSLALAPWGELLVTQPREGRIVALRPADDGGPATQRLLAEGLACPYGMGFSNGALYVAQSTRVQRFPVDPAGNLGAAEAVVGGLPESPCGPHHYRPLAIDSGGNLYVAFGSSCNVCIEADLRRGTVWRYAPDGSGAEYARGLRNVVDLELDPATGQLWGVTNERDMLGDDIPPDPAGPIVEGSDYGWPYCYWTGSDWVADTRVPARNPSCQGLTPSFGVPAHSAPLGISLASPAQFPPDHQGSAFVALHGSWNRSEGTGFKVIRVPIVGGQPQAAEDFVTGWLTGPRGPNDAWGRPVDVQTAPDGSLFVSDDGAGAVYRVAFTGG